MSCVWRMLDTLGINNNWPPMINSLSLMARLMYCHTPILFPPCDLACLFVCRPFLVCENIRYVVLCKIYASRFSVFMGHISKPSLLIKAFQLWTCFTLKSHNFILTRTVSWYIFILNQFIKIKSISFLWFCH